MWTFIADQVEPPVWHRSVVGALGVVTGLPVPTLNGVWVFEDRANVDSVRGLLDEVAGRNFPFCLQTNPASQDRMSSVALGLGMAPSDEIPLMALEDAFGLASHHGVDGLAVRQLTTGELNVHAEVAAAGFDAPVEVFRDMVGLLGKLPGLSCYVGEVGNVPVTTAIGIQGHDGSVGVFNVATLPKQQGNGYGTAITAHAVETAADAGASWAWLQSSPTGFPVYERMGFHEIERWPIWTSPAAS